MWESNAAGFKPLDTANFPNQTIGWPNSEPTPQERMDSMNRRLKSKTLNEDKDNHE